MGIFYGNLIYGIKILSYDINNKEEIIKELYYHNPIDINKAHIIIDEIVKKDDYEYIYLIYIDYSTSYENNNNIFINNKIWIKI
jgi:hypothetical protein